MANKRSIKFADRRLTMLLLLLQRVWYSRPAGRQQDREDKERKRERSARSGVVGLHGGTCGEEWEADTRAGERDGGVRDYREGADLMEKRTGREEREKEKGGAPSAGPDGRNRMVVLFIFIFFSFRLSFCSVRNFFRNCDY